MSLGREFRLLARHLTSTAKFELDHRIVHNLTMDVAISEAKAHLTDLVRRAEAGEDVVLTRHGQPAVRLVPVRPKPNPARKRALLKRLTGVAQGLPEWEGVTAATAADFLYDDDGLPA